MACCAAGHGTIRLHDPEVPASIDSITAVLMAGCMPKSSLLTISSLVSGARPSSSFDRTGASAAALAARSPMLIELIPPSASRASGRTGKPRGR